MQHSSIVVAQDSIGILCANHRRLLVSSAERSHSECQNVAVGAPIGAQDTNLSSEDWHSEYQDSCNELSIYIALINGYQTGIRQGASSISMRASFIKQNVNLKKL
jgi:hypothetical protein